MSAYTFKKVLSAFLYPVPLGMLILLIGIILLWGTSRRKTGTFLISFGTLFLLLLSLSPISSMILTPLERRYSYLPDDQLQRLGDIDYVVVLGGWHITDKTVPVTSRIGPSAMIRLVEGIRIHRKLPGSKLILSGGPISDPLPNAEIMKQVAVSIGVDARDIILESESKDTKDEAFFLARILGSNPFILVTSASHMPRSVALFKKQGTHPIPAPTGHLIKIRETSKSYLTFLPGAANLLKSKTAFHEYMGLAWSRLRQQL